MQFPADQTQTEAPRDICERQIRLDVNFLRQQGCLNLGCKGQLTWGAGGRHPASVSFFAFPDFLRLNFAAKGAGDDWHLVEENIPLVRSQQPFGGVRMWFACPGCQSRRTYLYGGLLFRCRNCKNLAYASQNENKMFRALTQAQNIRRILNGSLDIEQPFPDRPKHMHWSTYFRLCQRGQRYEQIALSELAKI